MKTKKRQKCGLVLAAAAFSLLSAGAVLAAESEAEDPTASCTCITKNSRIDHYAGEVTSVSGHVWLSQRLGYEPAAPGARLSSGASLLVGNDGTASLQVGDACGLHLESDTSALVLTRKDQQLCVVVTSHKDMAAVVIPVVAAQAVGAGSSASLLGVAAGVGSVGASAAISVGTGQDHPVSQ